MIRPFDPTKYPNITSNSPLIQTQLQDESIKIYIGAHITDTDLQFKLLQNICRISHQI